MAYQLMPYNTALRNGVLPSLNRLAGNMPIAPSGPQFGGMNSGTGIGIPVQGSPVLPGVGVKTDGKLGISPAQLAAQDELGGDVLSQMTNPQGAPQGVQAMQQAGTGAAQNPAARMNASLSGNLRQALGLQGRPQMTAGNIELQPMNGGQYA